MLAVLCSDDDQDSDFFWPLLGTDANVESAEGREYSHDHHGRPWPLCMGECSDGKSKLDRTMPGCCYSEGGKHSYGDLQAAQSDSAGTAYLPEDLLCWDGEGSN